MAVILSNFCRFGKISNVLWGENDKKFYLCIVTVKDVTVVRFEEQIKVGVEYLCDDEDKCISIWESSNGFNINCINCKLHCKLDWNKLSRLAQKSQFTQSYSLFKVVNFLFLRGQKTKTKMRKRNVVWYFQKKKKTATNYSKRGK